MKILTFLTCVILIAPSAYAATKCVNLVSSDSNCTTGTISAGRPEWSITCKGSGTAEASRISVYGVIGFGEPQPYMMRYNYGYESFNVNSDNTKNTVCYCKMIKPAISLWIAPKENNSLPGITAHECSEVCLYNLAYSSAFRNALSSNLISYQE